MSVEKGCDIELVAAVEGNAAAVAAGPRDRAQLVAWAYRHGVTAPWSSRRVRRALADRGASRRSTTALSAAAGVWYNGPGDEGR